MDYQMVISPDLKIKAEDFVTAWNQDSQSRDLAEANVVDAATTRSYGFIDPEFLMQGLVFLAGVGGTIVLDVLRDLIKERISKLLADKSGTNATPQVNIIVIQSGNNSLIVLTQPQPQ
jgi:hypothetical protein